MGMGDMGNWNSTTLLRCKCNVVITRYRSFYDGGIGDCRTNVMVNGFLLQVHATLRHRL